MLDPLTWNLPSERLRGWLDTAADLARRFAERAPAHDRDGSFPSENYDDLRAANFHLLPVPEAQGGWGVTLPEAVRVLEQLAQGDGATALVFAMHVQVLGGASESRPWDADQFAALCRDVVANGGLVNSIASEPELGSPSRGGLPATVASWEPEGWRVTGRKSWASGSFALGHFLVPAVLRGPDIPDGTVGVFDLKPGRPGLRIEDTWNVVGMRGTASNDLVLENLLVSHDDLLVRRSPGAADAGRVSSGGWFGFAVAAVYLGIAEAARNAAIDYAKERKPTALAGKSISTLEVIQQRLGALEAELLTARSLLYALADAWHRCPERRPELLSHIGANKVVATTHAVAATDLALRVVGGGSMSRDLPLERLFRDVRAGLFHPPAEEAGYAKLGQALFESEQPTNEEV